MKFFVGIDLGTTNSGRFKSGATVVASNIAKILTYDPRRNVRKNF